MWKKVIPVAALTSALAVSTVTAAPANQNSQSDHRNIDVQLLGINDFHGQLTTVTKVNGREAGGVDYLAAYIREREKQNPNTLLVHAGDMVGGSPPISALLQDEPTINILNTLGFDIGTLGNHEFDEGVTELKRLIYGGYHEKTGNFEGANFPYIAANAVDKKTGQPLLPPFAVKNVNGVKIGFIGVVTKDTQNIVMPTMIENVTFTDEAEAINKYAKVLKRMGVETIVVLAHNPGVTDASGNTTGEMVDLAYKTDEEVDVIFGGHNHAYVNGTVNGKLLVQGNSYGSAFVDVDLTIDRKTKDVVAKKGEVVTTYRDAIQPDPQIKAMVDQYAQQVAPLVNEVVGKSATAMNRTQSVAGESALGNLIADAQRLAMNGDIALMNPGGIRNDLDAGDITWGELYNIQPFGNELRKLTLTGKDIRDILNMQWQVGKTRMLQISGMTYTWDAAAPIGSRILDIKLSNGELVTDEKTYTVVANAFIAAGGDGFTPFTRATNIVPGPVDLDALVNYVKASKEPVSAQIEGRIQVKN
ncbi:bifunctional metallophosphatase/5'-nucleotidase [Ectobacillus antri]|jgi:2',3'-cyclic-nucleotide 2'-phosphodiesterase (5'-nucleotidase family)|uniref:bifunctional metallophosphatase/5'-nucleotidase n=1 Tax=Ectobacillus antri TaxID=2486280 RepID=UPI000F59FAD2|nr:5'-nucleotidase C-terminal domain-containing protein [Ectobacillus antri]